MADLESGERRCGLAELGDPEMALVAAHRGQAEVVVRKGDHGAVDPGVSAAGADVEEAEPLTLAAVRQLEAVAKHLVAGVDAEHGGAGRDGAAQPIGHREPLGELSGILVLEAAGDVDVGRRQVLAAVHRPRLNVDAAGTGAVGEQRARCRRPPAAASAPGTQLTTSSGTVADDHDGSRFLRRLKVL